MAPEFGQQLMRPREKIKPKKIILWAILVPASIILAFAILLSIQFFIPSREDKVLDSLGQYESKQFWSDGEYRDYTDFGIYTYSTANLDNNEYFQKIADNRSIYEFLDHFESWVDTIKGTTPDSELVNNYSFDRAVIDSEDYFYIYQGNSDYKFECYDIWFFDSQTKILYYFHNNI